MTSSDEIICVKNVFKVFGTQPALAMKMIEEGASKAEVFKRPVRQLVFSMPTSPFAEVKSL